MTTRMRKAFSLLEVVVVIGLASLLSSIAMSRAKPTMELFRYRFVMQQVAGELEAMKFRSRNEGRMFIMRIDDAGGMLQVVAVDTGPTQGSRIQRTIWLPEGLDITKAPEQLVAPSTGQMPEASIEVEAEAFQRIFRLTTHPTGLIELREDLST